MPSTVMLNSHHPAFKFVHFFFQFFLKFNAKIRSVFYSVTFIVVALLLNPLLLRVFLSLLLLTMALLNFIKWYLLKDQPGERNPEMTPHEIPNDESSNDVEMTPKSSRSQTRPQSTNEKGNSDSEFEDENGVQLYSVWTFPVKN